MSKIVYYGYSAFVVYNNESKYAIDPGVDEEGETIIPGKEWQNIDLVLVTHNDDDHAKMASSIAESSHATLIAHEGLESELNGPNLLFKSIKPGEEFSLQGIHCRAIKATHGPDKAKGLAGIFSREKAQQNCLGFIIESDERTIIHLGDTLLRGDWQEWSPDVLMVPIGGMITLDPDEAVQAVKIIKPRITIPMHYNIKAANYRLPEVDPQTFKESLEREGFDCMILMPGESFFI